MRELQEDYTTAPITEQERAMLDYVVSLTKDATRITRQDHERLREVGFDDRAIVQITLIAAWFNYINRVADALGVGRKENSHGSENKEPVNASEGNLPHFRCDPEL